MKINYKYLKNQCNNEFRFKFVNVEYVATCASGPRAALANNIEKGQELISTLAK
jgi:hypothetical protein